MTKALLTIYSRAKDWIRERVRRAPSAPRYYWQQMKGSLKPDGAESGQASTLQASPVQHKVPLTQVESADESTDRMQLIHEVIAAGQSESAIEQFKQSSSEYRRQYWNQLTQIDHQFAIAARSGATEEEFLDTGRFITGWIRDYELCDDSSIVLDIGCGAGRVAYHVAPLVKFLYGIDVSDEMVARAKVNLSHLDNTEIRRTDGESLEGFDDKSMDLVYSILVLQHMERENCYRMFREMARVLRLGGKALVQLPWCGSQMYSSAYDAEPGDSDLWYGRLYSEDELRSLYQENGFSVMLIRVIEEDLWGIGVRTDCPQESATTESHGTEDA